MASWLSSGHSPGFCVLNAAYRGNLHLLKRLVAEVGYGREERAKALMDVKDPIGRTVLHYAANGGKTHVCKYLIEELKIDANVKDKKGNTPLHIAVLDEQYLTCAYLLDNGAQPNAANHKGFAPLHFAAAQGRPDQLRLLISKGAEVDSRSFRGTPLQYAATKGKKNAVKILLDNHANPNSDSPLMCTPLVLVIAANSINCVRLLLKAGADPNLGSHGVTPLTMAVSEGQTEIAKYLLKAGADPNATDFYDFTPVERAAIRGSHADVTALLPATTPIPSIPNWSVDGILDYVKSAEAENQRKLKIEEKFLEAKAKGAEAFTRNDYLEATYWYNEAMAAKPKDATVYSNRSLCWARLNEGNDALKDAMACILLRPDWPKAYYRAGVAWRILHDYKRAVEAFELGLMMDSENNELQDAKREAEAALRATQMDGSRGGFMGESDFNYDDFCSMMCWLTHFG